MNYSYLHKVTGVVAGSLLSIMLVTTLADTYQPSLAQDSVSNESITIKKTATSVLGVPIPGHMDHQVVLALPSIGGEKLWVGKVTWISSEPIEVGFAIAHNQSATDTEHSNVSTVQFRQNNTITTYAQSNLTGATPQTTFGTTDFVADLLVFHSTNNTKFTVTYAVDAVAKDITNIP
jgi:hypothetical protein